MAWITSGKDSDSPDWEQFVTAWITSSNIHRRHLSTKQRSAIAAQVVQFFAVEAKRRMEKGITDPTAILQEGRNARESTAKAGEMFNVSARTVADAKKVMDADPEMFEKIKTGEVAPSAAAKKQRPSRKPTRN
ncbi:hypothetical protein [Corynebacterium sp. CNJ-954]|uniref:hypothetical protein n=1 Tax=Corynebacterium sp. CNJ-954 TaxID=1904962 RepID=UPI0011151FA6|nr:hypothetical protein [Corynebacterium sp. CNJ-954]